jgi:diazepam-binding inhibitor (GABA receptor modulating acyl-CoA-binding protein)
MPGHFYCNRFQNFPNTRSQSFHLNSQIKPMDIKAQFERAVADSKSLSEKPSNETLLELYSLYKQSTEGDASGDGPSNPFDFVNKAKHEAWSGLKGKTKEAAMQEYIELVNKLKG